jgi:hypothetical protein
MTVMDPVTVAPAAGAVMDIVSGTGGLTLLTVMETAPPELSKRVGVIRTDVASQSNEHNC